MIEKKLFFLSPRQQNVFLQQEKKSTMTIWSQRKEKETKADAVVAFCSASHEMTC